MYHPNFGAPPGSTDHRVMLKLLGRIMRPSRQTERFIGIPFVKQHMKLI